MRHDILRLERRFERAWAVPCIARDSWLPILTGVRILAKPQAEGVALGHMNTHAAEDGTHHPLALSPG